MARPKKQIKLKEPVKIRSKKLANGNRSVFLDVYWKGVRKYEFLKLYLLPEIDQATREKNRETMEIAERIKAERIKALRGHGVKDWDSVKQGAMLLTAWIRKFCEGGVGVKESSRNPRYEMLNTIEKFLADTHRTYLTLEELNADICRDYVKYLRTLPNSNYKYGNPEDHIISANTAHNYLALFSTSLNNAVRQGVIRSNPVNELSARERIQPKEGKKEYLTIEEIKILSVTDCYRTEVKMAFLFSCFTGLRLSDIYRICPANIYKSPDGETEYINMDMQKTEKKVMVPLSNEAKRWLPESKGVDVPYFDLPTTGSVLGRALRVWVEAAGIEKHISFHCARHTFGTLMLTLGADLYTTSKLMGHSNIQTTEIYAKIVDKKKEQAINLIDDLFK